MKIDDIITALIELSNYKKGSTTRGEKAAFLKVAGYLEEHKGLSLNEAIRLAAEQNKPTPKKTTPKRAAKPVDQAKVDAYDSQLREAVKVNFAAAEEVMGRINKDKGMRLIELKALCEKFIGSAISVKTKANGYSRLNQAIRQRILIR